MAKKISAFTELAAQPANGDLFLLELASSGVYRKIKWQNVVADLSITTAKLADASVTNAKVISGAPIQVVTTSYTAVATGTTTIPLDDTIPQNTEGFEVMTQAITPKSATNILVIEAVVLCSNSAAALDMIGALFQDATANALAADCTYMATATGRVKLKIKHTMVAGTTSATTFRVRIGGSAVGTTTFNGFSGGRLFGATSKSNITITEYKA